MKSAKDKNLQQISRTISTSFSYGGNEQKKVVATMPGVLFISRLYGKSFVKPLSPPPHIPRILSRLLPIVVQTGALLPIVVDRVGPD